MPEIDGSDAEIFEEMRSAAMVAAEVLTRIRFMLTHWSAFTPSQRNKVAERCWNLACVGLEQEPFGELVVEIEQEWVPHGLKTDDANIILGITENFEPLDYFEKRDPAIRSNYLEALKEAGEESIEEVPDPPE